MPKSKSKDQNEPRKRIEYKGENVQVSRTFFYTTQRDISTKATTSMIISLIEIYKNRYRASVRFLCYKIL